MRSKPAVKTARKPAEEALRESERRLRFALQAAGMVSWELDVTSGAIEYSNNIGEFVGGSAIAPYCSVASVLQQIHEEDRESLAQVLKRAMEQKASFEHEYRARMLDGSHRWILATGRFDRGKDGQPDRILGVSLDITQRKGAEDQLRVLSRAVEQSSVAVIITDPRGNIEHVNPRFSQVTGYSLEEVRGQNPRLLKSGETSAAEYARLWQTITSGREWHGEFHNKKKNGELFWESASISPLLDEAGRITHFVAIKEEITGRKLLEKQKNSFTLLGQKLSAATTQTEAARIILDTAFELFGWDAAYVNLYSDDRKQIVPVVTVDRFGGERVELGPAQVPEKTTPLTQLITTQGSRLIQRGEFPQGVAPIRFGDVNRPSESMLFAPIRSGGVALGVLSVQSYTPNAYTLEDLKLLQSLADYCGHSLQRIRASLALHESERRLRLIAENTADVIFAFDMDRRPIYANPAVETLTGYTFEEIKQRGFINWIHPDDQQRMLKHWDELFEGRGYSDVEFRLVTKQGGLKWCSSTWGPMLDENNRQIGVQGRERDVTQRHRLEQEVLESSAREQRRISHDLHDGLGQVLTGLALKARTLEDIVAGSAEAAALARQIVTLISSSIKQTRNLARGLDPIQVGSQGLPEALHGLAVECSELFPVKCVFTAAGECPAIEAEVARALYRIVQEAVHNAAKHARATRVDIKLAVDGSHLRLTVTDDGHGLRPKSSKDAGLGLHIMRYRASSIGANLSIGARPGGGTAVVCRLPYSPCDSPKRPGAAAKR